MYILLLIPTGTRTSTIEILDILPLFRQLDSHSDTNLARCPKMVTSYLQCQHIAQPNPTYLTELLHEIFVVNTNNLWISPISRIAGRNCIAKRIFVFGSYQYFHMSIDSFQKPKPVVHHTLVLVKAHRCSSWPSRWPLSDANNRIRIFTMHNSKSRMGIARQRASSLFLYSHVMSLSHEKKNH